MIFKETLLEVVDNSGARTVRCIQTPTRTGGVREGGSILVSVRKVRPGRRIQKGNIYKAVVVHCRKPTTRPFGQSISFRSNRVVLLKRGEGKKGEGPVGTRISRPLPFVLRKVGLLKLLLLAPGQL